MDTFLEQMLCAEFRTNPAQEANNRTILETVREKHQLNNKNNI